MMLLLLLLLLLAFCVGDPASTVDVRIHELTSTRSMQHGWRCTSPVALTCAAGRHLISLGGAPTGCGCQEAQG